ncbi:MAG: transcriptional repressor [Armatimonadota bacterium]
MRGRHPWIHGKFRECGFRFTVPRQYILQVLKKSEGHLPAEEIYFKVRKLHSGTGLTTVYRTLELLVNMGVLSKIDTGEGKSRYELVEGISGKKHHHHLVCTKCGKIIDYADFMEKEKEFLAQTEKGLSAKYDFDIKNHKIYFTGFCKKCR